MKSRLQLYTAPADRQLSSAVSIVERDAKKAREKRERCTDRETKGERERERACDKYKATASYACVEPAIVNYKFRRETDKKKCVREREQKCKYDNNNIKSTRHATARQVKIKKDASENTMQKIDQLKDTFKVGQKCL